MTRWSYKDFEPPGDADRAGEVRTDGPEADDALVANLRRLLLDEVDRHELRALDLAQRRVRLERVLTRLLSRERIILTGRERNALVRRVVDEAIGLGILEPILGDDSVSEIMINGHRSIYVERNGQLEEVSSAFASEEQLRQTIDRIVSTVNRRVDESSPMVDARIPADVRMPRGARVNVILPPLSLNGPTVTIRLFPRSYDLAQLIDGRTLDRATAELLAACVTARLNIVVSGGTASGKTTILNALSAFIPASERIITVEDAAELSLQQAHTVRLETRPPNVEGRGAVTVRDLVRNALRMRPDRIIVGEVRGGEALDMLQAMHTGHEGSLATVHANSPEDALYRLETLASMSDLPIPFEALREQVNSAMDVVVQLERAADGVRRVVEVSYVASRRREPYDLVRLMHHDPEVAAAEPHTGGFVGQPLPPALAARLGAAAGPVPAGVAAADGPRRIAAPTAPVGAPGGDGSRRREAR